MHIESQVAIVTGASSGIGEALVGQLAAYGVRVGLTARRAEILESIARSIRSRGGIAAVAPADARDPAATRAAFARLTQELGPADLFIANAGVGIPTCASAFSAADLDHLVAVNLSAAALGIELVLPEMLRKGRGQIVGISSLGAFRGLPGSAGYCATKAALSTLLEGLRVELRTKGIVVTVVHPGFVRTPMTAGSGHWQPFLMDAEPAARIILRGIAARRREVNFPWTTSLLMAMVRHLPGPIYDRLIAAVMGPGLD